MTIYKLFVIAIVAIAMMTAGCTSSQAQKPDYSWKTPTPEPTPALPAIEFKDVTYGTIHYGWGEVKGKIVSNVASEHSVAIYVDFYNKDGVKIDHVLDYVNVDGYGEAAPLQKAMMPKQSGTLTTSGNFSHKAE
jgi:hypothetical protein